MSFPMAGSVEATMNRDLGSWKFRRDFEDEDGTCGDLSVDGSGEWE